MNKIFLSLQARKKAVDAYLESQHEDEPQGPPTFVVAVVVALLTIATFAIGYMAKEQEVVVREVRIAEWPNTKCVKYDWSGVGGTKECWVWKRLKRTKDFQRVQSER